MNLICFATKLLNAVCTSSLLETVCYTEYKSEKCSKKNMRFRTSHERFYREIMTEFYTEFKKKQKQQINFNEYDD